MEKLDKIITIQDVKQNPYVKSYIDGGNETTAAMGYTDHGVRHASIVSAISRNLLQRLGYSGREQELAAIAGYTHDMGNVVSRFYHAQVGAALAERIFSGMGMDPDEITTVMGAIGSHDPEESCTPVSPVSAALIIADKSDVHRSRVRNPDMLKFDMHDRVNYAATRSFVDVNEETKVITLELTVDTDISPVMEYFEIFLTRMLACKRAAEFLGTRFELTINKVRLL